MRLQYLSSAEEPLCIDVMLDTCSCSLLKLAMNSQLERVNLIALDS